MALLYDDSCDFIEQLLDYNLTFLINDEKYVNELLKYNKNIKMLKYNKNHYDILISTTNNIDEIRASKKIVLGQTGEHKKRVYYLDKFDINEIFKEPEKNNYKFSIIVPNYNNGDWINKTIESVLNQTYNNWEMYIIDDMSKDNSIKIINQYKDSKIHLIQNEIKLYNGGSRNIGILRAKKSNPNGYLLFIDSDDWLAHNEVLERLNKFIEDEDLITLDYQFYSHNELRSIGKQTWKDKDEMFMTIGSFCAVWCKCFKVSIAPLFEFNTLMEDRNYHYRVVNRAKTYTNFGEVTHIWNRMNTKSVTTNKYQKYDSDLQLPIEWNNCAYRHIAGMLDLLNELDNQKYINFIKNKIDSCIYKVNNNIYQQY